MNESTYTAILLKANDWKDYDRRVRLFTLEAGAMTAVLKGVKRPNAKLKFGAQPFAFCQYTITEGKGGNVVIGCSELGDFFPVTADPDKYIAGSLLLEAADAASYGQPQPDLFLLLLACLKQLAYGSARPAAVAAHFLLLTTDLLGYGVDYGPPPDGPLKNLAQVFSALQSTPTEELSRLLMPDELAVRAAKMQAGRFCNRTDTTLKSVRLLRP